MERAGRTWGGDRTDLPKRLAVKVILKNELTKAEERRNSPASAAWNVNVSI